MRLSALISPSNVLLFGVKQRNNVNLISSILTNNSLIGCSDIIEHE